MTIFHFRRAIPSHLRALFGRSELTCSLRTSDHRLAGARARELYLHWEAIFGELRSETPMLSDDLLAHLGQEFYATVLDSDAKARMRGARITEQVRQGWIAHWKGVAERARRDLGGKWHTACRYNDILYAPTAEYRCEISYAKRAPSGPLYPSASWYRFGNGDCRAVRR